MRCPWCRQTESKVVDSRPAEADDAIRRRRECVNCGRRFTTFERVEEVPLTVVKRDGSKEPFDRTKVVAGILKATKNRPIATERVEDLAAVLEQKLRAAGPIATSQEVGLEVLALLRPLDDVAYLRFASVYKDFQELTDFEREVGLLLQKREPSRSRARRASHSGAAGR